MELQMGVSIVLTFQQVLVIMQKSTVSLCTATQTNGFSFGIHVSVPVLNLTELFFLFFTLPVARRRVEPSYFRIFFKKTERPPT
jgi:hypothetical protein